MRYALALLSLLFAARAHAASITVGQVGDSGQPAGTIAIQGEFVDVTKPSEWSVKSPTGPNPFPNGGWQTIRYTNLNAPTPPPNNVLAPFYVDTTEALFWWQSTASPPFDYAIVDVSEFLAAGDTSLVMRIDSERFSGPGQVPFDFEVITWESPNLGVVTRTYVRVPEPASAALLALCPLVLRRRRIVYGPSM